MSVGKIYEKGALLLRQHVGEATGEDAKYELSLINGSIPAVKSSVTGKTFVLNWEDILEIAIAAGIDA